MMNSKHHPIYKHKAMVDGLFVGTGSIFRKKFVPVAFRWRVLVASMVALLVAVSIAAAAPGQSIRLHDQAGTNDDQIRLRDVAELEGPETQALGDIVLTTLKPGDQNATITLDQVRERLSQHGVNWGKLTLRGYAQCRVARLDPQDGSVLAAPAPLIANPMEEVSLASTITLRERLIEFIERFAETDQTDLQITFADHDEPVLSQSAWQDRYEFEPLSSTPLGRVPIIVRRFRDDRLVESARVTADVAKRYMAAVVIRSIGRGQMLTPGDVEIQEVFLDSATAPVTDLSQVIGETAGAVLRTGAVLYDKHLHSARMVRRGQLMTVRCISGGLVVKTVARAKEDGVHEQIISVRNEQTRELYAVRVTGTQEGIAILSDKQNLQSHATTTPSIKRAKP